MPQLTYSQSVEEFHGPYGPYQVSELVLQKIWLEQAFDVPRLLDQRGRRIEVEYAGTWNRLDGPDFKDAVLLIDGVEVRGDVEVHFSQADWKAHSHDRDPAYNKVILHVLYYTPTDRTSPAVTAAGTELARVSLLPLLWYSLEEYAGEDSLIASTGVDLRPEVESLLNYSAGERRRQLVEYACRRWKMKLYYAGKRIERLGWEGACHQSALEVMGFARNRVPMLMIAEQHSLSDFASGDLSSDDLMEIGRNRWRFSGCRPANYPRLRLQQYLELAAVAEDWPKRLANMKSLFNSFGVGPNDLEWGAQSSRLALGVLSIRKSLASEVFCGKIMGQKSDTLVCDALLPLLAASQGADAFAVWFHWNAGNGPESCSEALRLLQVLEPRRVPMSNGWLQGIIGAKSPCSTGEKRGGSFQADA